MSFILPKGIVVNAPGVSGDIERKDREPLTADEIAKFWKVYTTTKRRLLDPTAERLENLWWRIWGSRRRELNGAIVARLFSEISDGKTVVPLRGPSNRYEAGGQAIRQLRQIPGTASSTAINSENNGELLVRRKSSNASKLPIAMPPPILKKTRGPSTTGPRPTARFVSPHSSDEEAAEGSTSTSSPNSHVIVRPPTPESQPERIERKQTRPSSQRKNVHVFTASTAKHRQRPEIPRRPSSQSSTGSDSASKVQENTKSTALEEHANGWEQPVISNDITSLAKQQCQSKFVENFSFSPKSDFVIKESKKPRSNKSPSSSVHSVGGRSTLQMDPKGSSTALRSVENDCDTFINKKDIDLDEQGAGASDALDATITGIQAMVVELKKPGRIPKLPRADVMVTVPDISAGEENPRSKSDANLNNKVVQPLFTAGKPSVNSTTPTSFNPLDTGAGGKIDSWEDFESLVTNANTNGNVNVNGDGNIKESEGTREKEKRAVMDKESLLFAKRPVKPIARAASALFGSTSRQIIPAAIGTPLNRSKSQLTLLLEKDPQRTDAQKRN